MTAGRIFCKLFLIMFFLPRPTLCARDVQPPTQVSVAVYNDAGVNAGMLHQAESEAARLFREAGVDIDWVNCLTGPASSTNLPACTQAEFRTVLQLRILAHARTLDGSVFGVSYLGEDGSGCYSLVFFERVKELDREYHQDPVIVLGYVMAHEVAHLLLGANSHSEAGIMRAHWQWQDLVRAGRAELHFTPGESERMRERMARAPVKPDGGSSNAVMPTTGMPPVNSSWPQRGSRYLP